MTNWLRGVRSAVVMGLAWALVWAPIAVLIGTLIVDPDNSMDEMWVVIGAYPGFLCAVIFSALLAVAERGYRLHDVPLSRVGAWGAVAGLLVGAFPFAVGRSNSELPVWLLAVAVIGSITLLSAVSAVGSALLARMAKNRQPRDVRAI